MKKNIRIELDPYTWKAVYCALRLAERTDKLSPADRDAAIIAKAHIYNMLTAKGYIDIS